MLRLSVSAGDSSTAQEARRGISRIDQILSSRLSNIQIAPLAEEHESSSAQNLGAVDQPSPETPVESPLPTPTAVVSTSPPAADRTSPTTSPDEIEEPSLTPLSPVAQIQQADDESDSERRPLLNSSRQSTDSVDTEIYAPPHPASAPPEHPLNTILGSVAGTRDEITLPSPRGERPPATPTFHTQSRRPSEFNLPRWQPDAEVTYCPICHSQFNIFVRKHHCRFAPASYMPVSEHGMALT
jgi:hypothetical protein